MKWVNAITQRTFRWWSITSMRISRNHTFWSWMMWLCDVISSRRWKFKICWSQIVREGDNKKFPFSSLLLLGCLATPRPSSPVGKWNFRSIFWCCSECHRSWNIFHTWKKKTEKVFSKGVLSKRVFSESVFSKSYYTKVYFSKVYHPKVYFLKV